MIPVTVILAIAACFAIVAGWRPIYAVALVIIASPAYLLRSSVGPIPVTALEACVLGTALGWGVKTLFGPSRDRGTVAVRMQNIRDEMPRRALLFVGMVAVGWTLATVFSIDHRASLGALKAWFIEPALIGCILLVEMRTDRDRTMLRQSLHLAVLWVAVAGLAQVLWFRQTVEDGRLSSVFSPVANYYAMFAAPLVVFAFGMAFANRGRLLALASACVGSIALFFSFSYGGFLSVIGGCVALAFLMLERTARRRVLAWFVVAVIVVFISFLPTRYFREKFNFTTRSSSLVRTEIWRTALEIGREHPVFGVGPNAFEKAYRDVAPTIYHPPLEWLVAKPHNLYLNLWVETGMFALLGAIGFFAIVLARFFRSSSTVARVVAASVVSILIHGFVDTPLYKNDLALLAVVLVAVGLSAASRSADAKR